MDDDWILLPPVREQIRATALAHHQIKNRNILRFLNRHVQQRDGASTPFSFLYSTYCNWTDAEHVPIQGRQVMSRVLRDLGFPILAGTGNVRHVHGVLIAP